MNKHLFAIFLMAYSLSASDPANPYFYDWPGQQGELHRLATPPIPCTCHHSKQVIRPPMAGLREEDVAALRHLETLAADAVLSSSSSTEDSPLPERRAKTAAMAALKAARHPR